MKLLNGLKTYIGGFTLIAGGISTLGASLTGVLAGDFAPLTAALPQALGMIGAGMGAIGLGHKLEKSKDQ